MQGRYIQVPAKDGQFAAYLAVSVDGKGPGVVLCQEIFGVNEAMRALADHLAEEGYTVLVPDLYWRQQAGVELGYTPEDFDKALALYQAFDENLGVADIDASLSFLKTLPECSTAGLGVVGYCLGGKLAYLAGCRLPQVACAVGYYGVGIENALHELVGLQGRLVLHLAELDGFCPAPAREAIVAALAQRPGTEAYVYPGVDHAFARPAGHHYHKPSALLAHERSIAALRRTIGPDYNLSDLWEEHIRHEFDTRDVPATMATMVPEPYVNHIPTMTGGVGYRELARFYRYHFVHGNPKDMALTPISRTIGASQIVDEFIMSFTHDQEIDWLLPGVAPTGRFVEIPMLGVVKFRGPKLYHEHIYWDQASVLVQIGLLDPKGLPVAGAETAHKLLDESLPSNTLMPSWPTSAGKPIEG
ncbi:Carboxymethylenebutenolidase [Pseudomonas oleovorans subsp. oleovorans]|uniref:Putative hydrolase n=1 Tax=Ectopseudomonas oleovorans TaxID=301 RepID=A0A379JS35_ECTOL|nr:dienelactone hydrolase family protein [Pseudomonas oleovorans]OWK42791.1 Carboxymethylenebutenolidase [Pseudomonas oleovorans subsp. oleovorans]SEJ73891.1 carboxymethylenebutenolidase [Pseudomonas oleovorans]SUD51051.1 putative hydrolase [Pseudomonas oleovorans]